MAKPIRSSVRSMLFKIICNYNQVRHDENERLLEKKRILDEIIQATAGVDDENVRETIQKLASELKNVIDNNASESSYLEKVSTMTGASIRTLRTIKKEGSINQGQWNTPGKKRPRPPTVSNLDNFDVSAIRNKINEFYCVKKQVPTLRALHADLKESIGFLGCCETLRKILHENGFEFKKNKEERSILMEKFEISGWRQRFLRAIHKKREEGKNIVYLDETYVHQNYRPKKSWQGPSTSGLVEKISSGKRHIIVHAGSEQGFVPNALLVFSTKSKAADYHDDMNTACLLAGTPPWELDAGVLADKYRLRVEARGRGELPDAEEAERMMRGAAERLRERWREALEDSHYGTRTIGAILPIMDEWVDRGKGALTYRVTQVVSGESGHGCFGHYLHKIQREPGPQCHECGAADDTAQHTLEECNRWAVERASLRAATGVADLSLHSIIAAMLGSERKWEAVASFCEEVMSRKEEAERER
ncbi:uncharacterized protein LOC134654713 [Cydia amplana]|uniref:uncharacterized protein LOC134654713 n=1 Tax=Cydia amplana TaxID=1869771 RepID=UPI002FE53CA1